MSRNNVSPKSNNAPLKADMLDSDRFERTRRIQWIDLGRVSKHRVLVIGVGATGNETVKNLVLSGFRRITVIDMDRVVRSNLNRCVFFTEGDATGKMFKAEAVAKGAMKLEPSAKVVPDTLRLQDKPGSFFSKFDIVLGCVDNIETRLHANSHCWHYGVPYIDCGTRGTAGKVQAVVPAPPETPCIECSVNSSHMKVLSLRQSCTGREATFYQPRLGAEITTTSVVAAVQVREALKVASGLWDRLIDGIFYYDGLNNVTEILKVSKNPDCGVCGTGNTG